MQDIFELPTGKRREYHYVHSNGSALVIPILADRSILMVNQYRYLLDRESLEFPCGSVKDGATHEQTAWHEMAEETGHSAKQLFQIGEFNPYNGVTDEICRVYVARELQHVGDNPDETEEFELVPVTPAQVDEKIQSGEIWDGMTIAAWAIAKPKLEVFR
jgi:ADP-ribose pyrophosphatase